MEANAVRCGHLRSAPLGECGWFCGDRRDICSFPDLGARCPGWRVSCRPAVFCVDSRRCTRAPLSLRRSRRRSRIHPPGIVIKQENMEYKRAVHHAAVVLDLCAKAKKNVKDLFESPDNEVESLRLKTKDYEMIIAQHVNFTLMVIQEQEKEGGGAAAAEGAPAAEGEEKKAE